MLLRLVVIERVVPELSSTGEPVSYRVYARSTSGWRYDYCLIHATNRELIERLLNRFQVERLEDLQGVMLAGYVEENRLVRLDPRLEPIGEPPSQ